MEFRSLQSPRHFGKRPESNDPQICQIRARPGDIGGQERRLNPHEQSPQGIQNIDTVSRTGHQISIPRNLEAIRRQLFAKIDGPAAIDLGAAADDVESVNQTRAGAGVGELRVGCCACDGAGTCTGVRDV